MIQANELRIGNWVYSQMIDGPFQISNLTTDYDPLCKPIPLTEEILLKCGFSSPINGWYTSPNKTLEFGFNGEGKLILMDWFLEITSLHQLQNLYFALTNTELEINL